jgi:lipopolysaccharide/colanic/teichoic acid biosynthesis glycosyltransferase
MEQLTDTSLLGRDNAVARRTGGWSLYTAIRSVTDRALALVGLLILWPVMALIALAITRDSCGPALFRQRRIGRNGRVFWMYKFRTMCDRAEEMMDDVWHLNEEPSGLIIKIKNDPRVTRLGRFLRSTSIDELPQLLNVLKGDLALIGPRPPSPAEVARYDEHQILRLTATPGLTGLWQVSGRKNLTFDEMVELDIKYAERQSLVLDVLILLRTLPAVFSRNGAR